VITNTGLKMSNVVTKQAFNDMLGSGWDSGAQYSFCIQQSLAGNPQFWWVQEVLRKFPHPPDWEEVQRGPDGKYKKFPGPKSPAETDKRGSVREKLQKFAIDLLERGHGIEAADIIELLRRDVV